MKGIVWNGPEEMSVEEMPEPVAEPGDGRDPHRGGRYLRF